jgi:hypothetical protein
MGELSESITKDCTVEDLLFPQVLYKCTVNAGGGGTSRGNYRRECMGLLEYQAMPSLRDVAHDGVCVHSVIDQP